MIKPFLLLFLFPLLAFSQGSTNDYLLSQKPASGPLVVRPVTPAVGRLLGWPASINTPAAITLGTSLSITGTTLNAIPAWGDLTGIPAAITTLSSATAAGLALMDDASASAQRTTLGLGTLATQNGTLTDYLTTATAATTYQPLNATLTTLSSATAAGLALMDDADASAQRTTLGLGTLATQSGTFSGTSSGTNTGDQTITLTGDITGSGTGSFTTTLATVNSNVGSFGSATAAPAITVNAKGLVTAVTTNTITPAVGSITGLGTGVSTFLATPTLANFNTALSDADVATLAANTFTGAQTLSDTTDSTSSTTGALIVSGGIGVAKDAFINGLRIGTGGGNVATNTALGSGALAANTTGFPNTAIGFDSLKVNTTGAQNVATGPYALTNNTTGDNNTANGYASLINITTGSGNVALGSSSGFYETGSNSFYVNNQSRSNLAGDRALSLLYGTFAAAATDQQLTVNAGTLNVDGGTTGGKIALRETNTNGENVTGFIAPSSLAADVLYTLPTADGTNGQALVTNGSGTLSFATVAASGATLAANTFTGLQQFSGTTHAGIRLNNLTTTQRDALTGAAGMAIWNTTDGRLQLHNGTGWTAGMVRLDGDTMTGALTISSASSLLLGTAGSAVGSIGFRNATSGTATLQPPTGALGTYTVTLPGVASTLATLGANTFTTTQTFSGGDSFLDFLGTGSSDTTILKQRGVTILRTAYSGTVLYSDFRLELGQGISWSNDIFLVRNGAASLQMGNNTSANGATAIAQTLKGPNATGATGTGGSLTLAGGTGATAGGAVIISTAATTTQTERARFSSAGVTIGASGTAIASVISNTATLDFASTASHECSALTMTVTGAAVGDVVAIGVPNGSVGTTGVWFGWVSATDTVTIRYHNTDKNSAVDPASGTFRATVIKH